MRSFSDGHNPSTPFTTSSGPRSGVQGPRPYVSAVSPQDVDDTSSPSSNHHNNMTVNKRRSVSEGKNRLSFLAKGLFRRSNSHEYNGNEDDDSQDTTTTTCSPLTPVKTRNISAQDYDEPASSPETPPVVSRAQGKRSEPMTPTTAPLSRRKSLSIKTSFFSNLFPVRQGGGSRQFSGQSVVSTTSTIDAESPITPTAAPVIVTVGNTSAPLVLNSNPSGWKSLSEYGYAASSALPLGTTTNHSTIQTIRTIQTPSDDDDDVAAAAVAIEHVENDEISHHSNSLFNVSSQHNTSTKSLTKSQNQVHEARFDNSTTSSRRPQQPAPSEDPSYRPADNETTTHLPPNFALNVREKSSIVECTRHDMRSPNNNPFGEYLVGPSKLASGGGGSVSLWTSSDGIDNQTTWHRHQQHEITSTEVEINEHYYDFSEQQQQQQSTIRFVADLHNPRFAPSPFNIPEIVSLIIEHVDALSPVPHEVAPKRRKPMSWRHALLLYGNRSTAWQAFNGSEGQMPDEDDNAYGHLYANENVNMDANITMGMAYPYETPESPMMACLLVNRMWYQETYRVLYKNLHFTDSKLFTKFVNSVRPEPTTSSALDRVDTNSSTTTTPITTNTGPRLLVLHKLSTATQSQIKSIAPIVGGNLEWLEFYTCPQLHPTRDLMRGGTLKKIILPGCTSVTDAGVSTIARDCPLLEHLDLRACEEVSDKSVRVVAHYCRNLVMLNVGRTNGGHRITNRGIRSIARHTAVTTLGVAGCHINDTTVWELAIHRGPYLERLSFNNCFLLTNNSVPRVLGYLTKSLSVLELRGCPLVSDMKPVVLFKRFRQARQGFAPLIEGCELFESRMREAEYLLEMEISKEIFKDTLEWIYGPDGDVDFEEQKQQQQQQQQRELELELEKQQQQQSMTDTIGVSTTPRTRKRSASSSSSLLLLQSTMAGGGGGGGGGRLEGSERPHCTVSTQC